LTGKAAATPPLPVSLFGPDTTSRTLSIRHLAASRRVGMSSWLATFGCLAELAGDHDAARLLLEPTVHLDEPLSPMYWEYLRRASGWTDAELHDRQQAAYLAENYENLSSKWDRLLRDEVARLSTS
jgi:hypothetical protein